jgi:hypothetical protein
MAVAGDLDLIKQRPFHASAPATHDPEISPQSSRHGQRSPAEHPKVLRPFLAYECTIAPHDGPGIL